MNYIVKKIKEMPTAGKAAFVYTVASIINKGLHFISTPIFTRIMAVEEIGIVSNYSTWSSMVGTVATLGTITAVLNVALMEYRQDRKGYLKSIQTLSSFGTVITALIVLLYFQYFSKLLGMKREFVIMMFINIFFSATVSMWVTWQRYEYRYILITSYTLLSSIIEISVAMGSVLLVKKNGGANLAQARICGALLGKIVTSVPIYIYILLFDKPLITWKYIKFSLAMGLPMVGHSLSKSLLSAADRVMIRMYLGAEALGYYSVVYNLSALSTIVWDACMASLIPYIYERIDGNKEEKESVKVITWEMMFVFAVCSSILILFAPEIVKLVATEAYLKAIFVVPPVAAGIYFTSLYNLYSQIILYEKKSKIMMFATLAAAAFNIITNYFFIPLFGYVAAGYTTLASYILLAVIYFIASKKVRNEEVFFDRKIVILAIAVITFSVGCNYLYYNSFIRYTIIAAGIIFLFIYRKKIWANYKKIKKKNL